MRKERVMGDRNNIFFSIVTVCFNAERTIRSTIESVLCQKYLCSDNPVSVLNATSPITMSDCAQTSAALSSTVSLWNVSPAFKLLRFVSMLKEQFVPQ